MIGKTISHYKITEKLGEGGMGIVYKAQDLKLDRFVALKFLPPHLTTSEDEKQRFIHEAKAASALQHNNICAIHEIDETDDDQIFICMDYYEGETLDKRIKEKPLPIEETIDIGIQIAQGLTKAHEKEIVHRDLKPSNIMLTADGVVKILDFGLAKLPTQTKLTKEGATLGTISYMSPEQTRGDGIDARSDIWSLGVMLYEMISGQLPFKGDYDQAVMYAITNENPEALSGLRSGVPLELERIAERMLSKDQQERYQHIDDLLSELNKLKKDSKTGVLSTKRVPIKKSRKAVILLIAVVSIVMLAIAGYIFLVQKGTDNETATSSEWENSIAVLPFADLSSGKDQEYFCDGMTEQIISNLAKLSQLKVISRTSIMRYKKTDKSLLEIGKELNVKHILEGSIRKFGNRIRVTAQLIGTEDDFHVWTENYDRDYEELFDVQDDVSQAIASNLLSTLSIKEMAEIKTDRPNNIENYDRYMQAKGLHHKYALTQNSDFLQDAFLLLKEILKQEPDYLAANVELANVYNTYLEFNLFKTEEERNRYMQLQKKYIDIAFDLNPNSKDVLLVKLMVSNYEQELGYFSVIRLKNFLEYLKIYPNEPFANLMVAIWLRAYGLDHQSLLYFNTAVEFEPLFTWNLSSRGWAYFKIGEYEKAELDFKKAWEVEPNDSGNIFEYIYYLMAFNRINEAEILINQWQATKPESNYLHLVRAFLYAVRGDKENALSNFNKTIFGEEDNASFKLAILYLLLKDQEKAIELIIKGEIFRSSRGIGRSKYFEYLNVPYYKILHNDPRFQEILAKHKELYEENLEKYGDIDI